VLNLDLSFEQAQKIVALSESVRESLETSLNKIGQKAAKFFSLTTNTVMSSKFVKNFQRNDINQVDVSKYLYGEEMHLLNDFEREEIIPVGSSSPNASMDLDNNFLIPSDTEKSQDTDSISDLNDNVSSIGNYESSFGADLSVMPENSTSKTMEINTNCLKKIDWSVPEFNGPLGCDFYEKCKGLDNYRNYTEARSKSATDHLSKNECPYYNKFLKVIQVLLRFDKGEIRKNF
jgi:hypothetical protein